MSDTTHKDPFDHMVLLDVSPEDVTKIITERGEEGYKALFAEPGRLVPFKYITVIGINPRQTLVVGFNTEEELQAINDNDWESPKTRENVEKHAIHFGDPRSTQS